MYFEASYILRRHIFWGGLYRVTYELELRIRTKQQAGIAVGIEAIAGGNRMRIGALHGLEPRERRDQHEQRRARQMKVGHEDIDRAETIAGRDEDRSLTLERRDGAVLARGALEEPQRGGADRNDPPAVGPRRVQRGGGGF